MKKIFKGDIIVRKGETLKFDYEEITGNVDVRENATFEAPVLTTVGGYVYVRENATFEAPVLTTVGAYVYVSENATFEAPVLTTVGGYVYVSENATFEAPVLTTVGGYVYVSENATFEAPVLTTVGAYVDVRANATFTNTTYKVDSAKAQEICGKIKRNGFETPDGKHIIADGILTEIVSHRANVYKVRKIARSEIEYLITDGNGNYAHGATLAEAKEDLVYKVTDRHKSDYEHLKGDDLLSHNDAIRCYRVITGACSSGTRSFIENVLNGNRKDKYTIAEIALLTKGQYGNQSFINFFKL